MRSRIYSGYVTHSRLSPRHTFQYRTFMLWLDLDDLPRLAWSIPLFGYNRLRPCAIWDRDYLEPDERSLSTKLRERLRLAGCDEPVSRICVLTVPRVAHIGFNPLSLFWCFDADDATRAIIAEVRNTYGEAHAYVLHAPHEKPIAGKWARRYRFDKRLFVSPFNGTEGCYDLRVTGAGDRLDVALDLSVGDRPIVRTSLSLRAAPLDTRTLSLILARYPLSAALTLPRIAAQALVLRHWKGLTPRMKPGPRRPTPPGRRTNAAGHAIALATVAIPALATLLAIVLAVTGIAAPSTFVLVLTAAFYAMTAMGITMGFHRGFAHRAFHAPSAVRVLLGVAGSMAAQGPLLFWVAEHREHHQQSDTAGDPHSPHVRGDESLRGLRGFWHAHVGWMLRHESVAWQLHAPDVVRDRAAFFVNRWYAAWVGMGVVLPALLSGLWHLSWSQAAMGLLWGGLIRICLVHHATWSVNSVAHLFGRRPFRTADTSRNNVLVALLTFGEGWHNNHHAFPSSARQGFAWWEVDPSYAGIRMLGALGLATQIKLPDAAHLARRRAGLADGRGAVGHSYRERGGA